MKTNKYWDRVPEDRERIDRDHKRGSKSQRQKGDPTDDFQESMREDKRGPMEGMEEVPEKQ